MSRTRSVKRIFSFSSGTLKRLATGFAIGSALQQLDATASRFDLRTRGRADPVRPHRHFAPELAIAEHFDRPPFAEVDEAVLVQHLRCDLALFERLNVVQVNDLVLGAER